MRESVRTTDRIFREMRDWGIGRPVERKTVNGAEMEMECTGRELLLNAWIDGELDADAARAVETHLSTCGRCRAEADALRAVSRLVHQRAPRLAAPDVLRERVRRLAAEAPPARRSAPRPRWLPAAAAAEVLMLGAARGGYPLVARRAAGDMFARSAEPRADRSQHLAKFVVEFAGYVVERGFLRVNEFLCQLAALLGE